MKLEIIGGASPPPDSDLGLTVLCVHGSWHSAKCYEHFIEYFTQRGIKTHALSFRGHGGSEKVKRLNLVRIADYVADLEEAIEERIRPTTPLVLIGHSMGGAVVQKFLERDRKVRHAVLMASVPPHGVLPPSFRTMFRHPLVFAWASLRFDMYTLVRNPKRVREILFSNRITLEQAAHYRDEYLGPESYLSYLDTLRPFYIRPSRVEAKMLVLGAGRDRILTRYDVRATARRYQTEPVFIEEMSHDMMLDPDWRNVAEHIMRFCREIAPKQAG